MIKHLAKILQDGTVSIPTVLIQRYQKMGLTETDAMLIIHLLMFLQKEQTSFPTIEEIQSRMKASPAAVIASIERLIKGGFLTIDEWEEPETGVHSEGYNLEPLFEKIASELIAETGLKLEEAAAAAEIKSAETDIYSTFEKEFARPLTPMEYEWITNWLDKDEYKEELVRTALKEAVFAGKIHFRYIDRILLDWRRNQVRTKDEAREYAKQFRGRA